MYKKCKIVMLSTNITHSWGPQHFYILSDDEIKEGDWCMNKASAGNYFILGKINNNNVEWSNTDPDYYKIIATTDSSLGLTFEKHVNNMGTNIETTKYFPLPSIPQSFIDKYISEYNKGNKIEEVMVEYSDLSYKGRSKELKLIYNTILIKFIKDSWIREEVIGILKNYCAHVRADIHFNKAKNIHYADLDNWININL